MRKKKATEELAQGVEPLVPSQTRQGTPGSGGQAAHTTIPHTQATANGYDPELFPCHKASFNNFTYNFLPIANSTIIFQADSEENDKVSSPFFKYSTITMIIRLYKNNYI